MTLRPGFAEVRTSVLVGDLHEAEGGLKMVGKDHETLHVAVKAHNIRGLAGWDWARATVTAGR